MRTVPRGRTVHAPAAVGFLFAFLLLAGLICATAAFAGSASSRAGGPANAGTQLDPVVPTWTTDQVVTLFLGLLGDYNVFDEARFAVDDGAPGGWQSLSATKSVTIPAHDGAHVIHIELANSSFDADMIGSEADPLTLDFPTILDTIGPATQVRQPVETRSGSTAAVKFEIADNLSPKADAQLDVTNRSGEVMQVVNLGRVATGKVLVARIPVKVPVGRFTISVKAKDLAGNAQRRAGAKTLTVK
jgi:hypothetical protein